MLPAKLSPKMSISVELTFVSSMSVSVWIIAIEPKNYPRKLTNVSLAETVFL